MFVSSALRVQHVSRSASLMWKRHFTTSLPNTAKVIRYHTTGEPLKVLKVETETLPKINDDQILVKMISAPINPADINMIEGVYAIRPTLPAVAGNEGVGIVVEAGANVKHVAVNDTVVPIQPGLGTWRTHGVFNAKQFFKVPKDVPNEYLATMSVNQCTAYRLLKDFVELKPGDVVIQNGASSTVGQAVLQLANEFGLKTINIIRESPKSGDVTERLKQLGGYMVVTDEYIKTPQFKRLISDLPKPKLGLNCIGGDSATEIARNLDKGGVMVTYGGMSKKPVTIPTSLFIFKDITLKGFWLSQWAETHSLEEREKMYQFLYPLIKQRRLRLWMESYNFDKFHEALNYYYSPGRDRKIIISMI